jgi:hypothetical protein
MKAGKEHIVPLLPAVDILGLCPKVIPRITYSRSPAQKAAVKYDFLMTMRRMGALIHGARLSQHVPIGPATAPRSTGKPLSWRSPTHERQDRKAYRRGTALENAHS